MSRNIGTGFVAVTPSDSNDIAKNAAGRYPSALRFGTGGTAVLVGEDGQTVTLTNIANGETIPVICKRVNATSTTASAIIGIYTE
jgi:hypothetical protein